MRDILKSSTWIAGLQWLFFIFTNIVVIPITVGAALQLPQGKIISLLQLSFILTGIACILQALVGHHRAIMEGQSGLWWGVFLTLVTTMSAQGMPLKVLGGSLTVGVIISGIITMVIGLVGLGPSISRLFNPAVMGVFLLLLGAQLIGIFSRGMIGIPFGNETETISIDLPIASLSIVIVLAVIILNVRAPDYIRRYSLLIGIIVGWIAYVLIFKPPYVRSQSSQFIEFFPLGSPVWDTGIVITAIFAGLLNLANTSVALKGTDSIYNSASSDNHYRSSFTITGILSSVAGVFGLVPYAPYVSSIGFLTQTNIINRLPFIIGGCMFFIIGIIPAMGTFFSNLPLSVGSAVLFVAYLLLFNSSFQFLKEVKINTVNVYRVGVPIFIGIVIMTMPANYFETIPQVVRPLLSNGLLVGISLAILLENLIDWDQYDETEVVEELSEEVNYKKIT